ncbi:MAG TPA: hypothetical protein VHH92_03870 [Actinomycetota bacterium]|nr:hypothetical protein [Actinomycetota bacterium]
MYALAWACLALAAGTLLASLSRPGLGLLYLSTAASGLSIVFVGIALARRSTRRSIRPDGG